MTSRHSAMPGRAPGPRACRALLLAIAFGLAGCAAAPDPKPAAEAVPMQQRDTGGPAAAAPASAPAAFAGRTFVARIDRPDFDGTRSWYFHPDGLLLISRYDTDVNTRRMDTISLFSTWWTMARDGAELCWYDDAFLNCGRMSVGADGSARYSYVARVSGTQANYVGRLVEGLALDRVGAPRPATGRARVSVDGQSAEGSWRRWDGYGWQVNSRARQLGMVTLVPNPFGPGECLFFHQSGSDWWLRCRQGDQTRFLRGGRRGMMPPFVPGTYSWQAQGSGASVTVELR